MAKERVIEVPGIHGEPVTVETTSLARALQFVKLKVQEMVSLHPSLLRGSYQ
jgi:hypothetical protein